MTVLGRSRSLNTGRRNRARLLFTFAALLAMVLQSFVVQTHVHPLNSISIAAAFESGSDNAVSAGERVHVSNAGDHSAGCIICQALAASGHAALASAGVLLLTAAAASAETALTIGHAPRAHTHSWQSRAPPIHL